MSVKCILHGQDDKSLKLDGQKFIQEFEDVTEEVKSAVGVDVLKQNIDEHIANKENPHEVTTKQIGAAKESEVGSLYLWERQEKNTLIETEGEYVIAWNRTEALYIDQELNEDGSFNTDFILTESNYGNFLNTFVYDGRTPFYFYQESDSDTIYYFDGDMEHINPNNDMPQMTITGYKVEIHTTYGDIEYVTDSDKSAYPEDGEQDGYKYVYKKQIGESDSDGMKYVTALPAVPATPIAADEEIPYSWEEINAIALSGHAEDWISVGAIKSATLTEAVLGTTTHDIRVIGINQDNDQSITFQTKNCLDEATAFGSSAVWVDSTARSLCESYYNAFPGKDSIKTVSKGTCTYLENGRSNTATYTDETVWLLSESEIGLDYYSPLATTVSTTSNAECTKGKKFQYSYYSSNSNRIKTQGDSSSAVYYWERSRYYNPIETTCVCAVDGDGSAVYNVYNSNGGLAPAFVIGNEEALEQFIVQDDKNITDNIRDLLTKDTDSFQVGDILSTVRTDLDDNWALCNGERFSPEAYPELANNMTLSILDKKLELCQYIPGTGETSNEIATDYMGTYVRKDGYTGNFYVSTMPSLQTWTLIATNNNNFSSIRYYPNIKKWIALSRYQSTAINIIILNDLFDSNTWETYQIFSVSATDQSGLYQLEFLNNQWIGILRNSNIKPKIIISSSNDLINSSWTELSTGLLSSASWSYWGKWDIQYINNYLFINPGLCNQTNNRYFQYYDMNSSTMIQLSQLSYRSFGKVFYINNKWYIECMTQSQYYLISSDDLSESSSWSTVFSITTYGSSFAFSNSFWYFTDSTFYILLNAKNTEYTSTNNTPTWFDETGQRVKVLTDFSLYSYTGVMENNNQSLLLFATTTNSGNSSDSLVYNQILLSNGYVFPTSSGSEYTYIKIKE